MKPFSYILFFALVFVPVVSCGQASDASQIVLSWQAHNFYPSSYSLKAEVAPYSSVVITATLLENGFTNAPTNTLFTWYVDGKFFERGIGVNRVVLNNEKRSGDSYLVRVTTESDTNSLEASIIIPVGSQRVAIQSSATSNLLTAGQMYTIMAVPYFFDASSFNDFSFYWSINNDTKTHRGSSLSLEVPSGAAQNTRIPVSVVVSNVNNPLESARNLKTFFVGNYE